MKGYKRTSNVAAPTRLTLTRPSPLPSRSEVVELVADYTDLMEEGVSVVDKNVTVPSGVPIDVLTVDKDGAILIVDVFGGKNSSWITHVLHHMRWAERNHALIRQRYSEYGINSKKRVRAAVVVAKMTEPAMDALSFFDCAPLSCYRIRCFTTGEERFLSLEKRVVGSIPLSSQQVEKDLLKPIELTEAEISDFLGYGSDKVS